MKLTIVVRKIRHMPSYVFNTTKLALFWMLSNIAKHSVICFLFPILRPYIWRRIGCKVGKGVRIYWDVFLDVNYAKNITIEDDVAISNRVLIFCHRRNMSEYYIGGRYFDCNQTVLPVTLKRGAAIGMGAIIMPGVTVGRGAIVGAGTVVNKDVPDWGIVAGVPARLVRIVKYKQMKEDESNN